MMEMRIEGKRTGQVSMTPTFCGDALLLCDSDGRGEEGEELELMTARVGWSLPYV